MNHSLDSLCSEFHGTTYPVSGGPAKGDEIPQYHIEVVYSRLKGKNITFHSQDYISWDLGNIEDVWKDHRGPGMEDRQIVENV